MFSHNLCLSGGDKETAAANKTGESNKSGVTPSTEKEGGGEEVTDKDKDEGQDKADSADTLEESQEQSKPTKDSAKPQEQSPPESEKNVDAAAPRDQDEDNMSRITDVRPTEGTSKSKYVFVCMLST